jgi:hypothetical protein
MVVHVGWKLSVFCSQAAFGNRIFGGSEELNCDFSGWIGDGNRVEFDASYLWVGTRGDEEGVFGSIGVVFLVGYLIGSKPGCWRVLLLSTSQFVPDRKMMINFGYLTLILSVYFSKLWIHSIYNRGMKSIDEGFKVCHDMDRDW